MLEWMIAGSALCGAIAGFIALVFALKTVLHLRGSAPRRELPRARVHRILTSPRRKALPSGG